MPAPKYDWRPVEAAIADLPDRVPEGFWREMARTYGLPYMVLQRRLSRLRGRGVRVPRVYAPYYRWLPEDAKFLEDYYAHMPNSQIAARLGCSRAALRGRVRRRGIRKDSYTLADVARALGVSNGAVVHWRRRGWIKARNCGETGRGSRRSVSDRAIHAFLILSPARWSWARVTDRAWVQGMLTDEDLIRGESPVVRAARLGEHIDRRPAQGYTRGILPAYHRRTAMVKLTIALTPQQEEWLKAEARRLGISPAELLRRWIDQKRGEA